ncbi:MAG: hypothetical protein C0490_13245 [Marivirga sp.]|nr:hypothetical protein [Marivirga sp.]
MVKLPRKVELTLFLIREELKSRKFFNSLQRAGIDDCYYQTHLDQLIMAHAGLDQDSDKDFHFYSTLMEKNSKKIEAGEKSIMKRAMSVYVELMLEKKRRKFAL